jgi:DNA mismatch repair protein MutH
VFCATSWEETGQSKAILLDITSFDFLTDDYLIKEIEADYELIRNKLITQGFDSLTGSDGKWIQTRTKGAGHGSTSRAFYAKACLIDVICKITTTPSLLPKNNL